MSVSAQPFDVEAIIKGIGIKIEEVADFHADTSQVMALVEREIVASYKAGQAEAVAVPPAARAVMPEPVQPDMPDCWVIVADGRIVGTHDQPAHIDGLQAVRYVPAHIAQSVQPAEQPEFTSNPYDPPGLSNWLVGHDKGVRVTHRSGLFEQCHTERGIHANQAVALERLKDRLEDQSVQPAKEDGHA